MTNVRNARTIDHRAEKSLFAEIADEYEENGDVAPHIAVFVEVHARVEDGEKTTVMSYTIN